MDVVARSVSLRLETIYFGYFRSVASTVILVTGDRSFYDEKGFP